MELRCLHGDFCSRLFNRGTRSAKKYIYPPAGGQRPRPVMNLEVHPSRAPAPPFPATLSSALPSDPARLVQQMRPSRRNE